MKATSLICIGILAGTELFLGEISSQARSFGVSSSSFGRGTTYTTSRGGQAYVGPRGFAGETAGGRYAAGGERGAVAGGPNGVAATGRYGSAAVTQNGAAVAGRYAAPYLRTVPAGAAMVTYGGYACYNLAGVYYRPVIYGGETVYVIVQ